MPRHGYDGEEILWTGGPKEVVTPPLFEATAWVAFGMAFVATAFAFVRSISLGQSPAPSLLFAGWSVTIGLLARSLPAWWASGAVFTVTMRSVIWQRGPFRRSIERLAISYARITWSARTPHVGTLELVRAVPTGALRRRLALRLEGLECPDGVLAIIRGAQSVATPGHGTLPIAQRLDRDERVLWAARPLPSLRAYLPRNAEEWSLVTAALGLVAVSITLSVRAVAIERRVLAAGYTLRSVPFWALACGMGAAVLIVLGAAVFLAKSTFVRRARSLRETRYLISNKRVLIQRGREELHLERNRIIDVIDAPAGEGTRNLFLVIDGPKARALAIGGAFGEAVHGPDLHPVFECVNDSDGARRVLRGGRTSVPPPQRHAA